MSMTDPRASLASTVADPRRHGIHLRARMNECIVTLNLTWDRAWADGRFDPERLFAESDPFRLQNMTSRLLDLLHTRGRTEQEDALVTLMRPRAMLLHLAAIDLSGPFVSSEPLTELAQRVDRDIAQLIGPRPTRSGNYQAACIHARRFITYDQLSRDRDAHDVSQESRAAREKALLELQAAVRGSPAFLDWARKDPAFRGLTSREDFRRLLEGPDDAPQHNAPS